jgi:hypothetical protein
VLARQLGEVLPLREGEPFPLLSVRQPGKDPEPWFYDGARNRHWNPDHKHWHDGPPPENAAQP